MKILSKQSRKGWKVLWIDKVGTPLNFTVQSKQNEERSSMVFWHCKCHINFTLNIIKNQSKKVLSWNYLKNQVYCQPQYFGAEGFQVGTYHQSSGLQWSLGFPGSKAHGKFCLRKMSIWIITLMLITTHSLQENRKTSLKQDCHSEPHQPNSEQFQRLHYSKYCALVPQFVWCLEHCTAEKHPYKAMWPP